ncbi:hypothetical protein BCR44DRAFT_50108 [Catenaria anguillulae PL171]|uniref:NmrA-like domain-containing protein n=1 Tax=Catenaria anguillulae PL171 TaxID=765915 RepID=A0A1Y2HF76_9FUNG|nr:hypothetical protein BCR44DRAFT_50108 [Catenaria anguillulae PL171]
MSGCDILFIIPSNAENRVEQVVNYVRAAVRDRVKFILLLSLVQPTSAAGKQSLFARQFQDMETLVSESGIPCAFLRSSFFMQSLLSHYREIRDYCTISLPIGRGTTAPVDVKDVARAACAILVDPAMHAFKAYDLMGPQVLSGDDLAAAASRALGRRITFRACDPNEFIQVYRDHGVPEWLARGFFEILDLHATGGMGSGEEVGFFMHLTGHEPTTVETFFRACADLLAPTTTAGGREYHEPRVPGAYRGRGVPSKGYEALEQGEELYQLLRELVTDKQRVLQAKYDLLREEEANLDRMIDLFERWEHSISTSSTRFGVGGAYSRDDSAYIGGGDSDCDYNYGTEGRRWRGKSGRGSRRRRSSYVVDY